jgi:hypothetical protein
MARGLVEEWEGGRMSLTDTYEVEDIVVESMWLRGRRCGRTWKVFDDNLRERWRGPGEPDGV